MSQDNLTLQGVPAMIRRLDNRGWAEKPVRNLMNRWAIAVQGQTRKNMTSGTGRWLDTGQSRASVAFKHPNTASEIDTAAMPLYARVGSNLPKFRFGELGTGIFSEDPASAGARGGIRPRRFLRDAFDTVKANGIPKYLAQMAREIESEAARGA